MTLNGVGERDFQAAPVLGVNLNGRNFFTGKSVVGAEERCVAIGIERLPAEVRYIEIIPGRELLMPLKGRFGIIAGCDDSSIATLHLNAIRLEDGSLVLARKIHRYALPFRLGIEDDVLQIVGFAFGLPDLSGNEGGHRHGLHPTPALQTAVRLDSEIQKIIHRGFLSAQSNACTMPKGGDSSFDAAT